jgi:hypothetical protein
VTEGRNHAGILPTQLYASPAFLLSLGRAP